MDPKSFQQPLTKEDVLNHLGILDMIQGIFFKIKDFGKLWAYGLEILQAETLLKSAAAHAHWRTPGGRRRCHAWVAVKDLNLNYHKRDT